MFNPRGGLSFCDRLLREFKGRRFRLVRSWSPNYDNWVGREFVIEEVFTHRIGGFHLVGSTVCDGGYVCGGPLSHLEEIHVQS